jgi:Flp pilus assembly protein TadD
MNKQQILLVLSAIALFFILYFGCDVKSSEQKNRETARTLAGTSIDMNSLIKAHLADLKPAQAAEIQSLIAKTETDSTPSVLKQLSAAWHNTGHEDIAAHYAEQVAEKEKTDAAWSIAGANYFLALKQTEDRSMRDYTTQKAVAAFQNAVSLNPQKLEHRINLALCYTENPPADNPMKGILQLRELDSQNPNNVAINTQLARLAIKTGQFDRAIDRLEKVLPLEPNNAKLICLLAEAYTGANSPKAAETIKKCEAMAGVK